MIQKIKERIFPFIIALTALAVSASAAFYSVSGLSKLFAGAAFAVIVMAASLEIAKLVIASLLYQYRKSLPLLLKTYLSIACFVLILITSMGIYGFLSAAYQETSAKAGSIDSQISLIETKRDNVREQLTVYNTEKSTINGAVSDLRTGLSNNKIQYTNAEGVVITTTSSSTRKALEKQLDQAIERQNTINSKVDTLNQRLFDYETEIVEVSINNDIAGELGPLKYLSGLTGIPMDNIINYLLLVIIFVFDPLAISLVIAANFAFEQLNKNKKEEEEMKIFSWFKKKKVDTFKDMDVTLNDGLENEPIFEEEVIEPIIEEVIEPVVQTPITEEQMDVDGDGDIDEQDAIRIEKLLRDPNLPNYKRSYWDAILLQIKKRIRNKENIKTY
jgi:hypothetical protein|tara:strand:- start:78 stop:1241 length:1164 start_codon:yes stop_codon:yes gene_type:complete